MNYLITTTEALPIAIRRIAAEQVIQVRTILQDPDNIEVGIHQARKHFKRIRALLRLIRKDLGETAYKKQNRYYRDLGRELSYLRDATARLESLQLLKTRFHEKIPAAGFQELEQLLTLQKENTHQVLNQDKHPVQTVVDRLRQADEQVEQLQLTSDHWPNLLKSLEKVYKRGLKAYRKSHQHPSGKTIHEWRKRAKYLWYQFRLLGEAWDPVLPVLAEQTKQLSDLLGDHRDLTLLKLAIDEYSSQLSGQTASSLYDAATQLQAELLHRAQRLGARLYAEQPDAFKTRMGRYLSATWQYREEK